jgi:hypothetical protein
MDMGMGMGTRCRALPGNNYVEESEEELDGTNLKWVNLFTKSWTNAWSLGVHVKSLANEGVVMQELQ